MYMHTCVCICIHVYVYACMCMYAYMCMYMHTYVDTCIKMCILIRGRYVQMIVNAYIYITVKNHQYVCRQYNTTSMYVDSTIHNTNVHLELNVYTLCVYIYKYTYVTLWVCENSRYTSNSEDLLVWRFWLEEVHSGSAVCSCTSS